MSEQVVPVVKFAPLSRTGVLFGLNKSQLLLAVVAISRPLLQLTVTQNLGGALWSFLVWTLPLGVLAAGSYNGRSLLSRVTTIGVFFFRQIFRQTIAVPKVTVSDDETKVMIPGTLGERTRVLPFIGVENMNGPAFVWDRSKSDPTATAVLWVQTEGWEMAGDDVKAARTRAVANVCRELSQTKGVARVAFHARTYQAAHNSIPKANVLDTDPDSPLGRFAAMDHQDMLENSQVGRALRRDMIITITVSAHKAATEIQAAGGGVAGVSKVLVAKARRITDLLPDCGVLREMHWLSADEIRGCLRLAFDPAAGPFLTGYGFQLPANHPVTTAVKEKFTYLRTPDAYHRAWWIEQWPQTYLESGFLYELVAQGDIPHTFTQIWEPIPLYKTEREYHNQHAAIETKKAIQEKTGRPNSVNQVSEERDLANQWEEMQAGYGNVNYSGWLVVHAPDKKTLDESDNWVLNAGHKVKLNNAAGRQFATFATAALPLGYRAAAC